MTLSRAKPNNRGRLAGWLLATVLLSPRPAFAERQDGAAERHGETIVLEAHVGQRSADAGQALAPVLDELERLGYATTASGVDAILKGRVPRPGQRDRGTVADIKQMIFVGRNAFDMGKFAEAEVSLRHAVELIRRNPALLVLDTNNERVTYSAFVALSLTLSKLKRPDEATEIMVELLRMSSAPIPQAEYGPKAEELHRAAEKRAQELGRGTLSISVNDDRAMVFLDGQYRGLGKVAIGDLIAGTHYVFVQVPGTGGLQYAHAVRANKADRLDVDWNLETLVHIADRRPWLGFATEADHGREAELARSLARHFGRDDLIIVELAQINGVSYVVGTLYRADGGPPIGAFAPAGSNERLLRSLARYLYDGTVAAGLRVLHPGADDVSPSVAVAKAERSTTRSKVWPSVVGGLGLATFAGAAGAFHVKGYDEHQTGDDDGRDPYVSTMVIGSIAIGGGVYGWLRAATPASQLTAGLLGAGTSAVISGVTLLLVDQNPSPHLPREIRDTKLSGLVTGAAGVALSGVGAYLFLQDRREHRAVEARRSWSPSLLVGQTTGVAVAGQF